MTAVTADVVVPTIGRPSLAVVLGILARQSASLPGRVIVVDDRRDRSLPLLPDGPPAGLGARLQLVAGRGAGPAAARNDGWRSSGAEWIAFLDDDVEPPETWVAALLDDLARLPADVAGSQGRIVVPLPADRRPTDWERNVAGLERACWATADMAYRRAVLAEVGGFDERFPRAYREDADLALRVLGAGHRLDLGKRIMRHPVRPAGPAVSVRMQAGNADDALMRALHGRDWRAKADVPPGRRPRHLAITGAGVVAVAGLAGRRRRLAAVAGLAWFAGTAELAVARIAPGPRGAAEVAKMAATSAVLPATAVWHWARGWISLPRRLRDDRRPGATAPTGGGGRAGPHERPVPPGAVLFDRDGTLIVDVPRNGDPARVVPMAGADEAVARVRAAGIPTAVISNQAAVGAGQIEPAQLEAVNRRIDELIGPLGPWLCCTHIAADGCACRKPAPGLVVEAAKRLGVDPADVVVIGDIGADVAAATAAGARAILVPTTATRLAEVEAAPVVAADLSAAVDLLLGRQPEPAGRGDLPGGDPTSPTIEALP